MIDPYAVLGLQPNASEDEVKSAFRKLAKTCHPDLHPNDADAERRFKEINEAYDSIRNPKPQPEFGTGGFGFHGHPFNTVFDDIFSNLHGFRQRNPDIHVECRLTLEEAFSGKEVELQVSSTRGVPPRKLKVRIPPGVDNGMRMRVAEAGEQSHPNLRPGDLYLIIQVLPHSTLQRHGRDLSTLVPVSAFDVLLGRDVEVVSIDGKTIKVAIPAGFDSMRKLRLNGQGMPDGRGGRGDLLVELFVHYPPLTLEQRKLIEQAVGTTSG